MFTGTNYVPNTTYFCLLLVFIRINVMFRSLLCVFRKKCNEISYNICSFIIDYTILTFTLD